MRFIILFIFLTFSLCVYSQDNTKIVKEVSSNSKNIRKKEMYFKGTDLIWEINYANNGWQILDSISYEHNELLNCFKIYSAKYNELHTSIEGYKFEKTDCQNNKTVFHKTLSSIGDRYFLTKPYLEDLNILLKFDTAILNKKTANNFAITFKKPLIPSILSNYGIPFNELLNSCLFVISNDKLLIKDTFYYKNYTVIREYKYSDFLLEEVIIYVKSKKLTNRYVERFKINSK